MLETGWRASRLPAVVRLRRIHRLPDGVAAPHRSLESRSANLLARHAYAVLRVRSPHPVLP